MKKALLILSMAALIGGAQAAGTALVGDAAAGKTKSVTCAGCHGMDGNSMNTIWPKIAGQHDKYIRKQLANFKSGERYNASMSPMAMPLTEQDMADLAAYYSTQTITPGEASPELVDKGQNLYRAGNPTSGVSACIACHGPSGQGNPMANFPSLAGQHADYTVSTLKHFRSGERANDAGQMMRNIAAKMTDQEIEAVAQYIQGLQ